VAPGRGLDPAGDGDEHRVCRRRAHLLVERRETVDVEKEQRGSLLDAVCFRQCVVDVVAEQTLAGQSGEGVVEGLAEEGLVDALKT
jgi:hypothetical protein